MSSKKSLAQPFLSLPPPTLLSLNENIVKWISKSFNHNSGSHIFVAYNINYLWTVQYSIESFGLSHNEQSSYHGRISKASQPSVFQVILLSVE